MLGSARMTSAFSRRWLDISDEPNDHHDLHAQ